MKWLVFMLSMATVFQSVLLSYATPEFKRSPWYTVYGVLLGTFTTSAWFYCCKFLTKDDDIFVFSILWDLCVLSMFYLAPIIFLDVQLKPMGVVGLGCMFIGLLLLKLN